MKQEFYDAVANNPIIAALKAGTIAITSINEKAWKM